MGLLVCSVIQRLWLWFFCAQGLSIFMHQQSLSFPFAGGGGLEWGGFSVEAGSSFHWQWAAVSFWTTLKICVWCVFEMWSERLSHLAARHHFKHLITNIRHTIHDCRDLYVCLGQKEEEEIFRLYHHCWYWIMSEQLSQLFKTGTI